ncbi:MAG: hypothetical protein WCL39_09230 [Armatimonadota bacterium]
MRINALLVAVLALTIPVMAGSTLPRPWFLAGTDAKNYEASIEQTKEASALSLRSLPGATTKFGTIMQSFGAKNYRGKKMCFSATVKNADVSQWAGLWMRVDGPGKPAPVLAFDNMNKRKITGTSDWKYYEIVLDVPQEAEEISFGVLLTGPGQVWMTALKFEPVDKAQ